MTAGVILCQHGGKPGGCGGVARGQRPGPTSTAFDAPGQSECGQSRRFGAPAPGASPSRAGRCKQLPHRQPLPAAPLRLTARRRRASALRQTSRQQPSLILVGIGGRRGDLRFAEQYRTAPGTAATPISTSRSAPVSGAAGMVQWACFHAPRAMVS